MTQLIQKKVTIAAGETLSPEVDLENSQLVGIHVPSTFDGTNIGIMAASRNDDGSRNAYADVQNGVGSSSAYAITTAASKYVPIENLAFTAGLRDIKLKAGTGQSTTDTIFTLVLRQVA